MKWAFVSLLPTIAVVACGLNDLNAVRLVLPPSGEPTSIGNEDGSAPSEGGNVCTSSDPIGPAGSYTPASYEVACGERDPFLWPFSKNSIWNIPIGSDAVYVDANLGTMGACNVTNDLVYRELATDPIVEVVRPDHQFGVDGEGGTGRYIHIPSSFTYAAGPDNGASFLDVDGTTLKEFADFARPTLEAGTTGWDFGTAQLSAAGSNGGYGGSGLSVIGGTLRPGELTSPAPLHHALKVGFDWVVLSPDWPGKFRWPAQTSDDDGNNEYAGTLKALTMGSLVAIRPTVDLGAVEWKTPLGLKIATALQDYGAYVVDSTANGWQWPNGGYTMALSAQNEAILEVKETYGIDWAATWGGGGDAWTSDMQAIYRLLAVVDNNAASSPGGGGVPRRPLAPDFTASDAGSVALPSPDGSAD